MISEIIEAYNLGEVVVFADCGYVEVGVEVLFIVVVEDGAQGGLEVEVDALVELKICQGVHDPAFYADCVQFDCIFA